jgi:hypothetical protein
MDVLKPRGATLDHAAHGITHTHRGTIARTGATSRLPACAPSKSLLGKAHQPMPVEDATFPRLRGTGLTISDRRDAGAVWQFIEPLRPAGLKANAHRISCPAGCKSLSRTSRGSRSPEALVEHLFRCLPRQRARSLASVRGCHRACRGDHAHIRRRIRQAMTTPIPASHGMLPDTTGRSRQRRLKDDPAEHLWSSRIVSGANAEQMRELERPADSQPQRASESAEP